jgi:hypothetical protein
MSGVLSIAGFAKSQSPNQRLEKPSFVHTDSRWPKSGMTVREKKNGEIIEKGVKGKTHVAHSAAQNFSHRHCKGKIAERSIRP